jgi:hypothetical protein
MKCGRKFLMFHKNLVPPPSGQKVGNIGSFLKDYTVSHPKREAIFTVTAT